MREFDKKSVKCPNQSFFQRVSLMSFPYENEKHNSETEIQRKIWLNSVYWGTLAGLTVYAVTNQISAVVALQSYLKQIASPANDAVITVLSLVAIALLLTMATFILKYLCFGKNLWRILTVAAVIVVLHTTVCIYGTFQQNETKNFEPPTINSKPLTINIKPGNSKSFKQIR